MWCMMEISSSCFDQRQLKANMNATTTNPPLTEQEIANRVAWIRLSTLEQYLLLEQGFPHPFTRQPEKVGLLPE